MSDTKPTVRTATCPECGLAASLDPSNQWRPFCSRRCKLIDLGAWFEERHVIPGADDDFVNGDDGASRH